MGKLNDLTGKDFGMLFVLSIAPKKHNTTMWRCRCDCGKDTVVAASNLISGNTRSCGCLSAKMSKERNFKHGQCAEYKSTKIYQTWSNIKRRCFDASNKRFSDYGGRGIVVCDRWLVFNNFLADMGEPPSSTHSIDRIDNDGPYSPENCRWATSAEQIRNRRNARILTHEGVTMNLCDWAKKTGIKPDTIAARISVYGWSISDALTILPRRQKMNL